MKRLLLPLLFALFIQGCTDNYSFQKAQFIGKKYNHIFFETEQACIDAQPDPNFFLNCHQEFIILNAEWVEITLSDIITPARYEIKGDELIVKASDTTFEFSEDLVFEIISSSQLILKRDESIWNLQTGDSIWD